MMTIVTVLMALMNQVGFFLHALCALFPVITQEPHYKSVSDMTLKDGPH